MKAVVSKGKDQIAVEDVPNPKLEAPDDAIVRITTAAIRGSDLHMYEARSAATPGTVFGHENTGILEETKPASGTGAVRQAEGARAARKRVLRPC